MECALENLTNMICLKKPPASQYTFPYANVYIVNQSFKQNFRSTLCFLSFFSACGFSFWLETKSEVRVFFMNTVQSFDLDLISLLFHSDRKWRRHHRDIYTLYTSYIASNWKQVKNSQKSIKVVKIAECMQFEYFTRQPWFKLVRWGRNIYKDHGHWTTGAKKIEAIIHLSYISIIIIITISIYPRSSSFISMRGGQVGWPRINKGRVWRFVQITDNICQKYKIYLLKLQTEFFQGVCVFVDLT